MESMDSSGGSAAPALWAYVVGGPLLVFPMPRCDVWNQWILLEALLLQPCGVAEAAGGALPKRERGPCEEQGEKDGGDDDGGDAPAWPQGCPRSSRSQPGNRGTRSYQCRPCTCLRRTWDKQPCSAAARRSPRCMAWPASSRLRTTSQLDRHGSRPETSGRSHCQRSRPHTV